MNTKALRQKILDLAIHGKLVPQDPNDEPASVLLERIKAEKERLIKEGKIKRTKRSKAACDKPHYENEAPFEVPSSWEWTTIGDIAESNIGLTYKPTDICDYGIPVYRSNNIQNRCIDKTDLVRVDTKILDKQFLAIGDLLICARNGSRRLVGKCALIEELTEPTSFGAFMAVCRSIYNPWIYLLLNTNYFDRYLDDSNSTTINQVTQTMLLAFKIPFPPKKEQERVIKEVHKWFNLIDEVENESERLQAFITATKSKILDLAIHGKLVPQDSTDEPASELLKRINPKAVIACDNPHYRNLPKGWAVTTIKDMCENINGLWKGKKEPFVNVGVIRNANFTKDFKLDYSKIEYIDVEQRAFNQRHLKNGDLIVEKSGGSDNNPVGRAILYEGKDSVFSFSNFTMALRIKEKEILTSRYLYYFLLAEYRKGSMRLMQTQTTGLHNLILDKYMSMPVLLPPFSEQLRITEKIEELFGIMDAIKANL